MPICALTVCGFHEIEAIELHLYGTSQLQSAPPVDTFHRVTFSA